MKKKKYGIYRKYPIGSIIIIIYGTESICFDIDDHKIINITGI